MVITKERLPDAAEIPREWNPADLSSIELKIFTSPNLFNSPAAIAKGADLLPGHSIKSVSYTHLTLPTKRIV